MHTPPHSYTHPHTHFVQASLGIQSVFWILATLLISPGLQTADVDLICDRGTKTKLSRQNRERNAWTKKRRKTQTIIFKGDWCGDKQAGSQGKSKKVRKSRSFRFKLVNHSLLDYCFSKKWCSDNPLHWFSLILTQLREGHLERGRRKEEKGETKKLLFPNSEKWQFKFDRCQITAFLFHMTVSFFFAC